jgi:hypothetical protein
MLVGLVAQATMLVLIQRERFAEEPTVVAFEGR